MKKLRVIAILLLLTAFMAAPVFAAAGKARITTDTLTVSQGESFTLTVELTDADKIKIGTAALIYDTAALELLGGKCLVEGVAVGQIVEDKNAGTFLLMDATAVSGDIFTFEMRARENASAGDYTVQLKMAVGVTKGEYIDATGTVVTVTESSPDATQTAPTENAPDTGNTPDSDPVDTQPADVQQTPDGTASQEAEGSLPANTAGNAAAGEDTRQETADEAKPEFPWWILIAVLVVAAAAGAFVILNKKKANGEK